MPVLGYITYDDTKIDDSDSFGGVITALKPYSVYRNLKFYSPTTGDLNTWLQGNAVKMPLKATWMFNSTLTNNSSTNRGGVFTFTSNGTTYNGITLTGTESSLTVKYNAATVYSSGAWTNEAYRIIKFTEPVKYDDNEEFVRWFVDNAGPPPLG